MMDETEDEPKSTEIISITKKQQLIEEPQLLKQDFHVILKSIISLHINHLHFIF